MPVDLMPLITTDDRGRRLSKGNQDVIGKTWTMDPLPMISSVECVLLTLEV
jgi:hypothetical protein